MDDMYRVGLKVDICMSKRGELCNARLKVINRDCDDFPTNLVLFDE